MAKNFLEISRHVYVGSRHGIIRQVFVLIMANLFLLAGLVFALEIALILMGVGNIFLPWTREAIDYLNKLLF